MADAGGGPRRRARRLLSRTGLAEPRWVVSRRWVPSCVRSPLRPSPRRWPVLCSRAGSGSELAAQRFSIANGVSRSRLTSVPRNLSLPSSASTSSRPTTSLCLRGRRLPDAIPGQCAKGTISSRRHGRAIGSSDDCDGERPHDPDHPVRQRDPHRHRQIVGLHRIRPMARPGRGMDMALDDDAVGLDHRRPIRESSPIFVVPRCAACLRRHAGEASDRATRRSRAPCRPFRVVAPRPRWRRRSAV